MSLRFTLTLVFASTQVCLHALLQSDHTFATANCYLPWWHITCANLGLCGITCRQKKVDGRDEISSTAAEAMCHNKSHHAEARAQRSACSLRTYILPIWSHLPAQVTFHTLLWAKFAFAIGIPALLCSQSVLYIAGHLGWWKKRDQIDGYVTQDLQSFI